MEQSFCSNRYAVFCNIFTDLSYNIQPGNDNVNINNQPALTAGIGLRTLPDEAEKGVDKVCAASRLFFK